MAADQTRRGRASGRTERAGALSPTTIRDDRAKGDQPYPFYRLGGNIIPAQCSHRVNP
jgi:hypothetical protein